MVCYRLYQYCSGSHSSAELHCGPTPRQDAIPGPVHCSKYRGDQSVGQVPCLRPEEAHWRERCTSVNQIRKSATDGLLLRHFTTHISSQCPTPLIIPSYPSQRLLLLNLLNNLLHPKAARNRLPRRRQRRLLLKTQAVYRGNAKLPVSLKVLGQTSQSVSIFLLQPPSYRLSAGWIDLWRNILPHFARTHLDLVFPAPL